MQQLMYLRMLFKKLTSVKYFCSASSIVTVNTLLS